MSDKLEITLFGNPAIRKQGQPITGFISNKVPALVYYLATTGQTHSRNTLAGLLWGDFPETKARKNLRDVLSNLRSLALEEHLIITRQTVAFNRQVPYELDVEIFSKSLASGNKPGALQGSSIGLLQMAADVYKGDFLEGFFVPQAEAYEEWMRAERGQYRQQASQILHLLTRHFAEQRQYTSGIVYVSRLLAMEPWREDAHRQLMQLLAWSGQRSAALAQYETCCEELMQEFGVEPEERTQQLYAQIRDGETAVIDEDVAGRKTAVSNLPVPLTRFVGREKEIDKIGEMLRTEGCRIVTLVGPGGIGKTRLSIETAHRFVPDMEAGALFADGIYFVPLAGVETAELTRSLAAQNVHHPIVAAIADVLNVSINDPDDPIRRFRNYMREKEMLLVLDNFEHLIAAANFVAIMLRHAPKIKVLVTSRTRLNIRGEQILPMRGMSVPISIDEPDWRAYAAVQLFEQTAQAVDPDFAILPGSETAVIKICRLVAGLPLGIELSATWVRVLSCNEIVHEIENNIRFLEAETTIVDMSERHQSLWAVFTYSWDLLSDAEKIALRKLSVLRGGFDRQAAEEIGGASLGLLASFVDNSLVRRNNVGSGELRYELLEVLRIYAMNRLEEDHADAVTTKERYCQYFMSFLQVRVPDLLAARQLTALDEIGVEMQNIRFAWQWAVSQMNVAALETGLYGLFLYYDMRSRFQEGLNAFARASTAVAPLDSSSDQDRITWARLLARQGWFTFHVGLHGEALTLLGESVAVLRPLNAYTDLIFSLNYLGAVYFHTFQYEDALACCEESLQLAREIDDKGGMGIALNILSQIEFRQGDLERARLHGQESLEIVTGLENRWSIAFSLENLGRVAVAEEQYGQAKEMFGTVLRIREEMGDLRGMAMSLERLADTAVALEELARAEKLYKRSLAVYREIGNQRGMVQALASLGQTAMSRELYAQAGTYFQKALQRAQQLENVAIIRDIERGLAEAEAKQKEEESETAV